MNNPGHWAVLRVPGRPDHWYEIRHEGKDGAVQRIDVPMVDGGRLFLHPTDKFVTRDDGVVGQVWA